MACNYQNHQLLIPKSMLPGNKRFSLTVGRTQGEIEHLLLSQLQQVGFMLYTIMEKDRFL